MLAPLAVERRPVALTFSDLRCREDVVGMPDEHAAAFKTVAREHQAVVITRAVGPTCHQLLAQARRGDGR